VAVADLESAVRLYESVFGMTRGLRRVLPERGVEVQFMSLPGTLVELLAPLGDDSPVQKFLTRRGPGLHHLCFEVADLSKALAEFEQQGLELIDRVARPGAEGKLVAFLQPRSTGGVLIELQQA
jgi:methylmalonyl-CoA/ethylmalonyl-CoA epimerase